jgi:hypothetical protein
LRSPECLKCGNSYPAPSIPFPSLVLNSFTNQSMLKVVLVAAGTRAAKQFTYSNACCPSCVLSGTHSTTWHYTTSCDIQMHRLAWLGTGIEPRIEPSAWTKGMQQCGTLSTIAFNGHIGCCYSDQPIQFAASRLPLSDRLLLLSATAKASESWLTDTGRWTMALLGCLLDHLQQPHL